jgi:predicted negative regulator of RcsB-dependent stress response
MLNFLKKLDKNIIIGILLAILIIVILYIFQSPKKEFVPESIEIEKYKIEQDQKVRDSLQPIKKLKKENIKKLNTKKDEIIKNYVPLVRDTTLNQDSLTRINITRFFK